MRFVQVLRAAFAGAVLASAVVLPASATVVPFGDPAFPSVTVTPSTFAEAYYSTSSNTDVGNQSPANVESVLEGWFGRQLSFVGGGACGAAPTFSNNCQAFTNNGVKGGRSNLAGTVYGVHFGNRFIAFLYNGGVNGFEISGLRFGVSNIYVFNDVKEVPLPGAVWLMLAGLGGLAAAGRRKKA